VTRLRSHDGNRDHSFCEELLIPLSLFQSVIVSEPGVVQRISRTIAERMKLIPSDPAMHIDTDESQRRPRPDRGRRVQRRNPLSEG
jgi:hypothetical protein